MKYEEVVEYLLDIPNYTKKTTRENMEMLLAELDYPLTGQKIIHVAGTNGKGSTCAFLSSLLQAQGYQTGMFTSPHLVEINERIQINGISITEQEFCKAFEKVKASIETGLKKGGLHPSFFETIFLMAAVAFQDRQADYCIYEAGMGGLSDATNVVSPILSIITTISLEHTEFLGNTLQEIAREKAGIIKESTPVISLDKNPIIRDVIQSAAKEKHAACILLKREDYIDFTTDALYQKENAALAVKAMELLQLPVSMKALEQTRWPGRMEQILPGIYVDGAHNMEAIETLVRTLDTCHKYQNKVLLFSVAKDKNYKDMISCLCEKINFKQVFLVTMSNSRGCDARKMAECFRACGQHHVMIMEELREAFQYGRTFVNQDTMFLCTGSLYFVGELKKLLGGNDD